MQRIKKFLKSLQFRIFILVFAAAILPAVVMSLIYVHVYENRQIQSDTSSIISQAMSLNTQITTTGYLDDPSLDFLNAEFTALANAYSGRIMVINSSLNVVSDTYGVDQGKTIVWENVVRAAGGSSNTYYDRDSRRVIVCVPITALQTTDASAADSADSVLGVLLITKSTDAILQNVDFMQDLMLEILLITAIIIFAVALLSSRHATNALHRVATGIKAAQDDSSITLPTTGYTEAAEIGEAFNAYHLKMQDIDDSRSEFVSNVSHELKTPLTSMKVLADSINSMGGAAPIEMYREFMEDITHEIDRETNVINDLLSLVKLDKAGVQLNIAPVSMNETMELLLKRLRPIAESAHVELVLESFRPVTAEVDETKFTLAIMNLVENGIKYNHEGGYVHVSLNSDHQYCYIRVEDDGCGIPEDSLDRIFERFYRVDKSHSREIGGTGLGLAITANVIRLHRGEIKVSSTLDVGTTFDVRIPLKYIEKEVLL